MDTILMRAQIAVSGRYYFMVMDIPIDAHMDGHTDGRTDPLTEMRGRIEKGREEIKEKKEE